jgi:hypothetical protein
VDYLVRDAKTLGGEILNQIPHSLGMPSDVAQHQQRGLGVPGQLQRLFGQVERGEISGQEGTRRALKLLEGSEGLDVRDLRDLGALMSEAFEESEVIGQLLFEQEATPRAPRHLKDRHSELGLPPTTPVRRRRVAIAARDAETGRVRVIEY